MMAHAESSAARFADASEPSAPIRFTCNPTCQNSKSATQGGFANSRALFIAGMCCRCPSAAFSDVGRGTGTGRMLPEAKRESAAHPAFMPHRGYVANTEKYALGPVAFGTPSSPIAAQLVDFTSSTEVAMGKYTTPGGQATLMLMNIRRRS